MTEHCSFCTLAQDRVAMLVRGPHVNICNVCVAGAMTLVSKTGGDDLQAFPEPCSFCRQTLTRTQFRGQQSRICEDCIVMANDIIVEERVSTGLPVARLIKG